MPDSDAGYKWGALVFSPPLGPKVPTRMFGGKETFEGNLIDLVPQTEHEHWRDWLGTIAWEGINGATRVAIARLPAARPLVLDAENERLLQQVRVAWVAFLLSGGAAEHSGHAWILSGQAAGDAPGTPLLTIRSVQEQDAILRPFYWTRDRYTDIRVAAMAKRWNERQTTQDDSWFQPWVEIDELLNRRPRRPPILGYAMLAHASAWSRMMLEFAIPDFVRAAEGVVGLARSQGNAVFCERASRLVPRLRDDLYVGADLDALLPKPYQLRSDCVHGKVPFHEMQEGSKEDADQAAQLAYVAEVLAREALLLALRLPDWSVFESRENLEAAWASGAFP
jgi:hypothetical protein